jgi:hypothetical protein
MTPNIEISEGIRPAEELWPASYLKLVRFDKYLEDYYVVSAGKVVALDSNGNLVPAGLKLQAALYKTTWDATNGNLGANRTAARAAVDAMTGMTAGAGVYDANDVSPTGSGVAVNGATGNDVVAGEYVVENFFTAVTDGGAKRVIDLVTADLDDADSNLTQVLFVSNPIGIAPYNYFRWAGGDGFNPSSYNHHNYNMQHRSAVLCDYYIELPRIDDKSLIQFAGLSVVFDSGLTLRAGDFLGFDASSDMIAVDVDTTPASVNWAQIIGQVLKVDTTFPKDYLDRVRTAYSGLGVLDKMPGSASAGLPDNISYAGGTALKGVVRINLINR